VAVPGRSVFLNCPFDPSYRSILGAIVFCVQDAGFILRCALERFDSSEVRLDKICEIIGACEYGIHDISYVQLDPDTELPRFNMPFELGLFLGCKRFGGTDHGGKRSLILDSDPHRYQKFLSDIAGQDIHCHEGSPEVAVHRVRDWLRTASDHSIPGGAEIWKRYDEFQADLPRIREHFQLSAGLLPFVDFAYCVNYWLKRRPGI
jgi:hypothetical protein